LTSGVKPEKQRGQDRCGFKSELGWPLERGFVEIISRSRNVSGPHAFSEPRNKSLSDFIMTIQNRYAGAWFSRTVSFLPMWLILWSAIRSWSCRLKFSTYHPEMKNIESVTWVTTVWSS
jgi:hypothetical protein